MLIGRLTKELELKKTPSGSSVVNFTIAVDRFGKKQPEQPDADFISCVAWNQTAELMQKYVGKGSLVHIEGRLQTRNYTSPEGHRVYITEVITERVQFLDSRSSKQATQQFPATEEFTEFDTPSTEEELIDFDAYDVGFNHSLQ